MQCKKEAALLKENTRVTNDMVCILKDMQTVTIIYKVSVTNLEFTLGLTENIDVNGNKINDFFLPMSLRVGIHLSKRVRMGKSLILFSPKMQALQSMIHYW